MVIMHSAWTALYSLHLESMYHACTLTGVFAISSLYWTETNGVPSCLVQVNLIIIMV